MINSILSFSTIKHTTARLFFLLIMHFVVSICLVFSSLIRGKNILFRILTFAKPECGNVLQPEPRSGEGCNTLSHEGLANVNIRKRMLYRHCYIPSSSK